MKQKIKIPIHSFIDVITNSSSELFVIEAEKGLEAVQKIVEHALIDYPADNTWSLGHKPSVYLGNPTWYMDFNFNLHDDEELIKWLEMKGYKVEAPEKVQEPEAIIIEWERGYVSQGFINYISETFNTEVISH